MLLLMNDDQSSYRFNPRPKVPRVIVIWRNDLDQGELNGNELQIKW